jgi:nicotinamidase-related amidase
VLGNVSPIASEYSEVARRVLELTRCALVVIDIQEKLLPPIAQKERLLKNSQLLIRAAGILNIPTLMSTQ